MEDHYEARYFIPVGPDEEAVTLLSAATNTAAQVCCIQAASAWELKDVDTVEDLKLLESRCTAP